VTAIPASNNNNNNNEDDVHTNSNADFTIILNPLEPVDDEATALQRVRTSLAGTEVFEHLSRLLKYFDGEHALDTIAAMEGLKRARVEEWLELLEREELLLTFRAL
jgi:nitrogen permease regulator 3-like protein